MLLCIPTLARSEALAIARLYPTPASLIAALNQQQEQKGEAGQPQHAIPLHPSLALLFGPGEPDKEEQWRPLLPST